MAADMAQALGLDPADVLSRSSGAGGTDLHLSPRARARFPFAVECKNQERVNIWEAFEQAAAHASAPLDPLLVIARNRTAPLAVLRWPVLLALFVPVQDPAPHPAAPGEDHSDRGL